MRHGRVSCHQIRSAIAADRGWDLPTLEKVSARGVNRAVLLSLELGAINIVTNTINATSIHNVAYQNQKFIRSACDHAIDELPSAMGKREK